MAGNALAAAALADDAGRRARPHREGDRVQDVGITLRGAEADGQALDGEQRIAAPLRPGPAPAPRHFAASEKFEGRKSM